jgi:polysaccharide biosynthesis transport protein
MLRANSDYLPAAGIDAAPAQHDSGLRTVDLVEMVRILRRRLSLIAGIAGAFTAIALLYVLSATTQYTATSTVLVDPRRANVTETTQTVLSNFGTDDATIESQTLLIKSVAILRRVVDRMKLATDEEFVPPPSLLGTVRGLFRFSSSPSAISPEEAAASRATDTLQRQLKVVRQGTTFLVDINVNSQSPSKAAEIANAIADAYFEEQVRSKYEATRIAAGWLSGQIENLKQRVTASEKAVEDYRTANNLTVSQGVTVNDQQMTDLNNKLIEARVQTAETRAKYDQVQQMAKSGGDPGSTNAAISSEMITKLRTQYADIAKSSADLTARYGNQHPQVANVRAQLRDTQRLINEEIKRLVQSTKHDYDVAQSREKSLQASFEQLQGVSNVSNQALVHLHELRREAEANRTLYESYLARYKETSAQESLEMPDSRIVTRASIPIAPSFPKSTLIVGFALVLGLGIGCAAAFLADFLDRRVKTLDEAEDLLGLPALAAVPLVDVRDLARRAKRGRAALGRHDPNATGLLPPALQPPLMRYATEEPSSLFAESIRAIRLALQRALRIKPAQILLVTSAIDNEGKTTVAVNVALSLAALGFRTLLVDCDMRNPETTRSLAPRASNGLLQVALGQVPIERAILVDRGSGLSVLPAPVNAYSHATSELMFSERISIVFEHLRQHYDLIVLDCPPLLPLVDGRALAEQADQILLALAWDKTPRDAALDAVELLAPVRDRILGTVLTRVDMHRLRHYDYYSSSAYIKPYAEIGLKRGAAL